MKEASMGKFYSDMLPLDKQIVLICPPYGEHINHFPSLLLFTLQRCPY